MKTNKRKLKNIRKLLLIKLMQLLLILILFQEHKLKHNHEVCLSKRKNKIWHWDNSYQLQWMLQWIIQLWIKNRLLKWLKKIITQRY
jgi:hypothetical protein